MIVNDSYILEVRSFSKIEPGKTASLWGVAEEDFVPKRLDLGGKHGIRPFILKELKVGSRVWIDDSAKIAEGVLGTIKKGEVINLVVENNPRNITTSMRAVVTLIGEVIHGQS